MRESEVQIGNSRPTNLSTNLTGFRYASRQFSHLAVIRCKFTTTVEVPSPVPGRRSGGILCSGLIHTG